MRKKKQKPLTIAMVSDVYDDMRNGAAISLERFCTMLSKRHTLKIISTGKKRKGKIVVPSFYVPFAKGLMKRMKFAFGWPHVKTLKKAFSDVDIVHIHFPFYLGIKAVKVATEMNIPVVSAFHVQPENLCYNLGIKSELLVNLVYRFFIRKLFNRTESVICPSPFAENELKRRGMHVESHVISNGVMPIFKPMKTKRPHEYKNRFIILSVGRLAKDKRHDVLIHAIHRSKYSDTIQLIITGEGPKKEQLKELGKMLPIKPLFKFLPIDALICLYNTADLYVHPSEVELESMSVLEAIACGLPALISDSEHSAAKQFAMNKSFLFKCDDVDDLAEKIDYWITHNDELRTYKKKYVKLSSKYYIDESIRKIEKVYYAHAKKRGDLL